MTKRPCLDCGKPSDASRCEAHQSARERTRASQYPKQSSTQRGYDAAWKRISKEARRLQPFCTDCGSTDDLTTDHSKEAWLAWLAGKPITLSMLDVACRSCNTKRGDPFAQGYDPRLRGLRPSTRSNFALLSGSRPRGTDEGRS